MRSLLFAGIAGSLLLTPSYGENLIENGSFEFPLIKGPTSSIKGGNPGLAERSSWTILVNDQAEKGEGELEVGLTDDIANTGKQSVYVDFKKLTSKGKRGVLMTNLLPVKGQKTYRFALWGRIDKKRPLSMDQRRPVLKVDTEYFAADQETQVGETSTTAQMLPGSYVEGLGTRMLFTSNKWSEYSTELKSPTDAAFIKITVYVMVGKDDGTTNGLLYIDDATLEGERGSTPLVDREELPDSPTDAAPGTPPSNQAPAPATPTAPSK